MRSAELDRAVMALPALVRAQAMDEDAAGGGRFWSYFAPLALSRSPARSIDEDMKRALMNEVEPSRFPGSAGRWPALRAHLRYAMALAAGAGGGTVGGGLGQDVWETIASIVSTAGKAASSTYAQYLQSQIEKARAESLQKQEAMVQEAERAAAQQAAAQQAAATAQAQATAAAPAGGWPSWATWAIVAGLAAVGAGFAIRMVRRRR